MATSYTTFTVRGVESEADRREIEERVAGLEGVQGVDPDADGSEEWAVRFGEELLSEERILEAVRDLGYEVDRAEE